MSADPCVSKADDSGIPYSVRLKRLRESAAKSPEELAMASGVSPLTYRDWEWGEGDISMSASLAELSALSKALGIPTRTIFDDSDGDHGGVSFGDLCKKITNHIVAAGISIDQFEDRVGFEIAPALRDSSDVAKWNLDCLRFVCKEIGINWHTALS
jgi:transcriptional regulator with XRE-family HTH domain